VPHGGKERNSGSFFLNRSSTSLNLCTKKLKRVKNKADRSLRGISPFHHHGSPAWRRRLGPFSSTMLSLRSIVKAHVAACWLVGLVVSRKHHLFVANLNLPAALHSIVFDDDTLQANHSRTMAADSSHTWITFNASRLTPIDLLLAICPVDV
jgi:hypothetical protein